MGNATKCDVLTFIKLKQVVEKLKAGSHHINFQEKSLQRTFKLPTGSTSLCTFKSYGVFDLRPYTRLFIVHKLLFNQTARFEKK